MKIKTDFERNNLDKIIVERQLTPLMNNKKWVKLITVMVQNVALIRLCHVKLIWENTPRQLIFDENTSYDFDYYEQSMEAMLTGNPKGFYDYKEIEWLDFPCQINAFELQNLEQILQIISKIGKFKMDLNQNELRLYGYF